MHTPDPVPRLNAALQGRYRIEREIGEGGMEFEMIIFGQRFDMDGFEGLLREMETSRDGSLLGTGARFARRNDAGARGV